jgi:hypothetical protein
MSAGFLVLMSIVRGNSKCQLLQQLHKFHLISVKQLHHLCIGYPEVGTLKVPERDLKLMKKQIAAVGSMGERGTTTGTRFEKPQWANLRRWKSSDLRSI